MIGVYLDNPYVPWMDSVYRLAEKTDIVLFLNNFGKVDVHSKMAMLPSSSIWSFDGPIIAGDTFSACYLSHCPVAINAYFYINNIDWNNQAYQAIDIIKATSLKLATEPTLAHIVKAIFREPQIVRSWDYEDIKRFLGR